MNKSAMPAALTLIAVFSLHPMGYAQDAKDKTAPAKTVIEPSDKAERALEKTSVKSVESSPGQGSADDAAAKTAIKPSDKAKGEVRDSEATLKKSK